MRWTLLLDAEGRPGAGNMATDQALLDHAEASGEAVLRCYTWSPHCLSFGRHEPAARRYDRAAITRRGIDTVRRPTGGRAVWHARELTYAVAAPVAPFGTLAQSYCRIHGWIAAALRALGVEATLAPAVTTPSLGAGACFNAPVGGEVIVAGRKLVGSAQLRQNSAFLQHGSLLLEDDQSRVGELLLEPVTVGQETTLSAVLARPVTWAEVAGQIVTAMAPPNGWRREPIEGLAARIDAHRARFLDPGWTWRR